MRRVAVSRLSSWRTIQEKVLIQQLLIEPHDSLGHAMMMLRYQFLLAYIRSRYHLTSKPSGFLACAIFEMPTTFIPFLTYSLILYLLIRESLSVPATAFRHARDLATYHLSRPPLASSLDLVSPLNLTSPFQGHSIPYYVPNTYVYARCLIQGG